MEMQGQEITLINYYASVHNITIRPCGKKSTEVQITQK